MEHKLLIRSEPKDCQTERPKHPKWPWLWISLRLPRHLVYWCALRVMAHATMGQYSDQEVPALTAVEALKRW